MSDDFDKEAERKRLREKYEDDQEDREATERMSELLLQGATMTNRHCDTCGSPIFRYQGQEFCPTCQMGESAAEATTETAGENQQATSQGQQAGQEPAPRPQQPATQQNRQPATQQDRQPATQRDQQPSPQQPTQPSRPQQGGSTGGAAEGAAVPPVDGESLEEIRASLTQTLARFARRAAQTDDPHRAREHLDTAKRAAETLRELQG